MTGAQICVIRRFKSKDESTLKILIQEAAMERHHDIFYGIVFSQTLIQIAVTFTAILFIVFGIPLQVALIAFPLTVGFLYTAVYLGLSIKIMELHGDFSKIKENYMTADDTCFFVAEVYVKIDGTDIYSKQSNKVKKVEYEFVTEKEFEVQNFNLSGLTPIIAGCLAVTKAYMCENRAQIRRLTVCNRFRRRYLATELLKAAVKFSKEKKYFGIQAFMSEYHKEAFEMFVHEDFDVMPIGYKAYMFFDEVKQISVYRSFLPKQNEYMEERKSMAESGLM